MTTSENFDRIMNGVVIDFVILYASILTGLVAIGTKMENDNINSGSMLGVVYVFSLIPLVLVSVGLIAIFKNFLMPTVQWISSFAPAILIVGSLWLKLFDAYVLIGVISTIAIYSLIKPIFKKAVL